MGVFLYNIFLVLYKAGLHVAALFNPKARKWVLGRKGQFQRLEAAIPKTGPVIWMHCASLGEFEQGRPIIEAMKLQYPRHRILLTFFSPSGYEVRKDYKGADWVFYLPMDGARNARRFLEIVHPDLVIFVKYEFWYYYLKKVKYRNIPLLLVSAIFREHMAFFKWHGRIQQKMLMRFNHLFVQDELSKELLAAIGMAPITSIAGDTRFDRVAAIAEQAMPVPDIMDFIGNSPCIVAGSTWPADEAILKDVLFQNQALKIILAPHEIDAEHIVSLQSQFPGGVLLSKLATATKANVLIIDNIGMLSRLYQHATVAYVGGGFGKGIHNTLEAAVYGKPVLFGPVFQKFKEAGDLIARGGAFTVSDANALQTVLRQLLTNEERYHAACTASRSYVQSQQGATKRILDFIYVNRLLTR